LFVCFFYQIVNALDVVKKYLNVQVLLFAVVNALNEFTGMRLNLKETNISTKHNRLKTPNWRKADQLAIFKHDLGVELGSIEKQL